MIRRIVLHGELRKLVPGGIVELEAETVKDAVEMLCVLHKEALRPNAKDGRKRFAVAGFSTKESLTEKTHLETIHIVPSFNAGKSKFVQILVGVVLIATAFINPGGIMAAGALFADFSLGATLIGVGASLVLGGILQLLMPQPQIDGGTNVDNSKYLGAPGNTVRIGTRRPIGFGRYRVYGHYLSYNVSSEEFSYGNGPDPVTQPLLFGIWPLQLGPIGGTRFWWEEYTSL